MSIPKSFKGRTRHRLLFVGDIGHIPFDEGDENLVLSLRNRGYDIQREEYKDNIELPEGLPTNREYELIIGWIYMPEGGNLREVAQLAKANGWWISFYTHGQKGSIYTGRNGRRR
ncbi:MAG: hypothetical protein QXY45_02070 [Candidatus Aenigmatarchaeota archaeon]